MDSSSSDSGSPHTQKELSIAYILNRPPRLPRQPLPSESPEPPEMPYNTTAIPPRREPTGTCQLPLSRVKKIVALDQDINMCSNNASFVITLATELFIQYLAEQGHNVVKSERKPRRNIQYRDLANAVAHHDNLEFLNDIVPRTIPFKQVKEAKNPASHPVNGSAKPNNSAVVPGQTTLDGPAIVNGVSSNGFGVHHHDGTSEEREESAGGPDEQLKVESRGVRPSEGPSGTAGTNGKEVETDEDVEMS